MWGGSGGSSFSFPQKNVIYKKNIPNTTNLLMLMVMMMIIKIIIIQNSAESTRLLELEKTHLEAGGTPLDDHLHQRRFDLCCFVAAFSVNQGRIGHYYVRMSDHGGL